MKNKNILFAFILMAVVIIISGCAEVNNIEICRVGTTYGFWGGLWHGLISWLSFFGSLFSDDIALYAVNNNGGWYDFGFVLGAAGIGGGTTKAVKK